LATKKRGGGSGERSRPPLRSSHEPGVRVRSTKRARPASQSSRDAQGAWSVATDAARERATAIAVAALDKKAVGLEILDVAGKVDYADFLVIMTGRSDRHAQALAQGIEEALKKKGVRPMSVEGLPHGSWVLMDFGDVVVHVFRDETRQLYDLEGLWLDARRLPVPLPL
jgi:ribosome-associated protein